MTGYQNFHLTCLDPAALSPEPGDFVLAARQPLALLNAQADHLGLLEAGAPLFVEADAASLREAVLRHCFGLGDPSLMRASIAELLDPTAGPPASDLLVSLRINAWISKHALVRLRPHRSGATDQERRVGWFNLPGRPSAGARDGQEER